MKIDYCKLAITTFFDCDTIEDFEAYPKVRISAEITLAEMRKIHHFNTDEVKHRLEKAVAEAAWLIHDSNEPKGGADGHDAT